jgi:hypothetical protein
LEDKQLRQAIIAEGMQACNEGIFPDNSEIWVDAEFADVMDKRNEFDEIAKRP